MGESQMKITADTNVLIRLIRAAVQDDVRQARLAAKVDFDTAVPRYSSPLVIVTVTEFAV